MFLGLWNEVQVASVTREDDKGGCNVTSQTLLGSGNIGPYSGLKALTLGALTELALSSRHSTQQTAERGINLMWFQENKGQETERYEIVLNERLPWILHCLKVYLQLHFILLKKDTF